jgi:FPC/CPF motif-containing protein YcgG
LVKGNKAFFMGGQINPFGSGIARAHSTYAARRDGKLFYVLNPERALSPVNQLVHEKFRAFVLDPGFPCIGARAAINTDCYRFGIYTEMNTREATAALAHDLWEFVRERPTFGIDYATFVASFVKPVVSDELEWEELLWAQLQSLHELDRKHFSWDQTVSSDADDQGFSFSMAEHSFFVVGLHPASSRRARRFSYPTLVFNPHQQFERLRERGQFERMQQTIRARDLSLQGSLNPNLSNFGELSEARQYSGRAVEPDWRCPFRAQHGNADKLKS